MHPTFEFIAEGLMIALVLGMTITNVTTGTSQYFQLIESEQLNPLADRLFDKVFYMEGYPKDWGVALKDNKTGELYLNITDVGLATAGLRDLNHELDWGKTQKLLSKFWDPINEQYTANPIYLEPWIFGNLTGLYEKNHWNYGFTLKIKPALNITVTLDEAPQTTLTGPNGNYEVDCWNISARVVAYDGRPAAGANVTLRWGFFDTNADMYDFGFLGWNYTKLIADKDGYVETITVNNNGSRANPAIMLFSTAQYYGLKNIGDIMQKGFPLSISAAFTEDGKNLIFEWNLGGQSMEARGLHGWAGSLNADLTNFAEMHYDPETASTHVTHGGGKETSDPLPILGGSYSQDISYILALYSHGTGNPNKWGMGVSTQALTPLQCIDYGLMPSGIHTSHSGTFSRYATMKGLSYVIELTLWKMAE